MATEKLIRTPENLNSMRPSCAVRLLVTSIPLLLLAMMIPRSAASQSLGPGGPGLRDELLRAAVTTRLPDWQRDYMLDLARVDGGADLGSIATPRPTSVLETITTGSDGTWNNLVVASRYVHTTIYDPIRDRMVVFGGQRSPTSVVCENDVWALSLTNPPTWTELTPTGAPPGVRASHSAVYDPVRDRMLVFGGFGFPSYLNDVWALSLGGVPAWTELAPVGALPSGRQLHSAVYDPVRDRMLIFGGDAFSGYDSDVWALALAGTPTWAVLPAAGTRPAARYGQSTVYDPTQDRLLVFGGSIPINFPLNDTWSLSLSGTPTWTALAPAGTLPAGRFYHSATYDPVRERVVAIGGYVPGSSLNDVWLLSLSSTPAWSGLPPSGRPPMVRAFHSAVHDPIRDRMLVFGGIQAGSSAALDDVWALALAYPPTWTLLEPTGMPPAGGGRRSAVFDPVRDRMLVFGGYAGGSSNEVRALSMASPCAWTFLAASGTPPSGRYLHSAIYDPVRDRMLVFGGADGPDRFNEVWALALSGTPTWSLLITTGPPPSPRYAHGVLYDPARDQMVVFGGFDTALLNDVWTLSLAGAPAWTLLACGGTAPSARSYASVALDPSHDRMLVFGGYANGFRNDVWSLSLADPPAWTALSTGGGPPSQRSFHSAIYDPLRDRMVVFGGSIHKGDQYSDLNDVWALSSSGVLDAGGPGAGPAVGDLRLPTPNPTRDASAVSFSITKPGHVHIGIYDASGRLVRELLNSERRAGTHGVVWDGANEAGTRVRSGLYFLRMVCAGTRVTRRLVLLR